MALEEGCCVRLGGLQSSAGAELNDLTGTIAGYVQEKDRWRVVLEGYPEEKLLKAANLFIIADDTSTGGFCTSCAQPLPSADAPCPSCDRSEAAPTLSEEAWQSGQPLRECAEAALPSAEAAAEQQGGARRTTSCQRSHSEPRDPRRQAHASPSAGVVVQQENMQQDPGLGQLKRMLEEWQSANAQWQVAYTEMSTRCETLKNENRQLKDVVEAAESGPDMCARFVARLARQNWRLGQEAATHGADCASSDPGDDDAALLAEPGQEPADTGRDRRPEGVDRLPFRRDAAGNVASDTGGNASGSADEESDQTLDEHVPAHPRTFGVAAAPPEHSGPDEPRRWDPNGKFTAQSWRELVEERKCLQAATNGPRAGDVEESSAWSAVSRLAIAAVGFTLVATFTIGRLAGMSQGDGDFEL